MSELVEKAKIEHEEHNRLGDPQEDTIGVVVQIATCIQPETEETGAKEWLYALTDDGRIWQWVGLDWIDIERSGWELVPMRLAKRVGRWGVQGAQR